MKITKSNDGHTLTFHGDPDIVKANLTDDIFHQVSDLLGEKISGVKLKGYWIIYRGDRAKHIVSGDTRLGQRRRRRLSDALSDGLDMTVVTLVS